MNTRFAPLAHIFPQNGLFWTIFEVIGQILSVLSRSECSFHGTQNDRQDLTVSTQKSVWKTMHPDPRYVQNCFLTFWAKPNRKPKQILVNISGNIGSFYKPIFALKPWDCAGRFEYLESYILVKNGFSFDYLWALEWWKLLKYPIHRPIFFYFSM